MRLDDNVKSRIIDNLQSLRCEFAKYFADITRDDLAIVRNSYLVSIFNGDDNIQKEFIFLKKDSTTENAFKEKTLFAYWLAKVSSYPRVASPAIQLLMYFILTWLCEGGFSASLGIKNKVRNKLKSRARSKVCFGNNRITHRQAFSKDATPAIIQMLPCA